MVMPARPRLWDGFGLIVTRFLVGSSLFSQIWNGFGYCYACPDYILKIYFYFLFYTLISIIIIIRMFFTINSL